jgi:hypothetical protein
MKRKNYFLVSQKQAKMKRNKIRFALFRFEAKIKKERKRDALGISYWRSAWEAQNLFFLILVRELMRWQSFVQAGLG